MELKQLSIEQKAKAYDEAIKRGIDYIKQIPEEMVTRQEVFDAIFPELKETEDERIRKWIIDNIIYDMGNELINTSEYKKEAERAIAWLEKQNEQKNIECINFTNEFENQVSHLIASALNGEYKYNEGFVKYAAQSLLGYVKKEQKAVKCKEEFIDDTKQSSMSLDIPESIKTSQIETLKNLLSYLKYARKTTMDEIKLSFIPCIENLLEEIEQKSVNKDKQKFKVRYAGSEYNLLEVADIDGEIFYGIEDEPNHIDYINAKDCEIINGYSIKENGSPYPTKSAVFSEQKPVNKTELKFHEGDWVVFEYGEETQTLQIKEIIGKTYVFTDDSTLSDIYEDCLHLWSIKDAKDGDVLVCPKYANDIIPNIFIFKNINLKDNDVFCHCSFLNTFSTESYVANADPINIDFYPATKEQRNRLFQKMKEAGYAWDAEKKVLKELDIFYCNEHCKGYRDTGGKCFFGFDCPSRREAEQKYKQMS